MRRGMDGDEFTRWCIYYARKAQRAELADMKARGVSAR